MSDSSLLEEFFGREVPEIPEEVCCACGHQLGHHVDEGSVWRCHSLGQDFYQCECALRKDRAAYMEPDNPISYYDLRRRVLQHIEEEKREEHEREETSY